MVKLYSKEYELFLSSQCNKVKLEFDVEADFVYTEGEYHILVLLKDIYLISYPKDITVRI